VSDKFDIYSYFWNEQFGIDFKNLERKIKKEEISWRAKLIKLNRNKNKAKERYLSWFKNTEGKIAYISLCEKYNFLKKILMSLESSIPEYSCLIKITFTLKKPYLSKDDDDFYIIDNPIVKDKVFKLPMVRATTWKGALRFAALKVFEKELAEGIINESNWRERRALIVRLFGNEKDKISEYLNKIIADSLKKNKDDVKKEFDKYLLELGHVSKDVPSRSGRLFFYPTFFDRISLEVLTPLSRETKTPVRGPIYFEVVPERVDKEPTKGVFKLLYYSFDLVAKGEFNKIKEEMMVDLEFLSEAIYKMFYEIGFSAKKTSGFGIAEAIDVKVLCGERLKEYERSIQAIFENELKDGVSDD